MMDLAEAFRGEAEDVLERLEEALLGLEADPSQRDLVDAAFRALHTLKGSGAMAGFGELERFAHSFESAFDKVRSGETRLGDELLGLSLESLDHLRALVETGPGAAPALVEQSNDLLAKLDGPSAVTSGPDTKPRGEIWGEQAWRIDIRPEPQLLLDGFDPVETLEQLAELGDCRWRGRLPESTPPLETLTPGHVSVEWSVLLICPHGREALDEALFFLADRAHITIEPLGRDVRFDGLRALGDIIDTHLAVGDWAAIRGLLCDTPAHATLAPPPEAAASAPPKTAARAEETVKVATSKLDVMVDAVGELVTAQARLEEVARRLGDRELSSVAESLERMCGLMRDATLDLRMFPLGGTFSKFRRLVRDISKQLGKKIQFVSEGDETELDKTVIDRLSDPMIHLIRNSLDHGIESPADRRAAGKPEAGTILVAARHAGTKVVIEVSDDGKGLDRDRIREKALERGIISKEASLEDAEIFELIFAPGFSTASEVSALSGRGVGMDAVRAAVRELRGEIRVTSELGRGTVISIELPLTLAIIDGLVVRLGEEFYVMPASDVEECIAAPRAQPGTRKLLQLRGGLVPYFDLRSWFGVEAPEAPHPQVIVADAQGERFGLVVDEVVGQQQAVIKSLARATEPPEGVSGATILGDGGVALVLELAKLGDAMRMAPVHVPEASLSRRMHP